MEWNNSWKWNPCMFGHLYNDQLQAHLVSQSINSHFSPPTATNPWVPGHYHRHGAELCWQQQRWRTWSKPSWEKKLERESTGHIWWVRVNCVGASVPRKRQKAEKYQKAELFLNWFPTVLFVVGVVLLSNKIRWFHMDNFFWWGDN